MFMLAAFPTTVAASELQYRFHITQHAVICATNQDVPKTKVSWLHYADKGK